MPLINSYKDGTQTDLNKLTYESFNTSNVLTFKNPLIKKRIPTGENETPPISGAIEDRISDTLRISKLIATPQGVMHIANEQALIRTPELAYEHKTGKNFINSVKNTTAKASIGNTLKNLLLQIPLSGTGTHFTRGGRYFATSENNTVRDKARGRYGLGETGARVKHIGVQHYDQTDSRAIDQVNNQSPIFRGEGEDRNRAERNTPKDDFAQFYFELVDLNEDSPNSLIQFRAFIDSFTDNYTGTWNEHNYVGRGESFYTYGKFNRNVDISFKIAAQSKPEMSALYQKMVLLASSTAPTYSMSGFMRGTFVKLTLGDYFDSLPGFLNSVNFSWNNSYQWDTALFGEVEDQNDVPGDFNTDLHSQVLPMALECSVSFTPIHEFVPQTGALPYFTKKSGTTKNQFIGIQENIGGISQAPSYIEYDSIVKNNG